MTASAPEKTREMAGERDAAAQPLAPRLNRLGAAAAGGEAPVPPLRDFLTGPDNRVRDLLAYGMAAEDGRVAGADGVGGLHRRAEAELHAQAFRLLHNQVAEIRRQAVEEHEARAARPLSFLRVLAANLLALALASGAVAAALALDPGLLARLTAPLAALLTGT